MMTTRKLFCKNIELLTANRERLLSDSRMAYALGYSAPLGVHLQWWADYPVESHDVEGNPIIFVLSDYTSDSELATCKSVTSDGEIIRTSPEYWDKSLATFRKVRKQWHNPPENPYTLEDVIVELTTTGNEWIDRYVSRLRSDLREAHNTLIQKNEEIEDLNSFINVLRIERIRTNAYSCLDALKQDFADLDATIKALNKAQNDYCNERKRNPDSPCLIELKSAIENLSTFVRAKEKEMVESYNCNAVLGLTLTIDELRGALHYHIG